MKTAEEYVKDIHGHDLDSETTAVLVKSYREYAKQVADQALKDASRRATYIRFGKSVSINPDSITNTEIQLP
jgi:hypothetical protein